MNCEAKENISSKIYIKINDYGLKLLDIKFAESIVNKILRYLLIIAVSVLLMPIEIILFILGFRHCNECYNFINPLEKIYLKQTIYNRYDQGIFMETKKLCKKCYGKRNKKIGEII